MTNPCDKIFAHKWLDPQCVESGCQSLRIKELQGHKEEADRHIKTIAELRHEIDQLTGSKAALQTEIERLVALSDKMWIERVAERKELIEESQHRLEMLQRQKAEIERLKRAEIAWHLAEAEVERLRGVLADIKCGAVNITMAKQMADRAMEHKPRNAT